MIVRTFLIVLTFAMLAGGAFAQTPPTRKSETQDAAAATPKPAQGSTKLPERTARKPAARGKKKASKAGSKRAAAAKTSPSEQGSPSASAALGSARIEAERAALEKERSDLQQLHDTTLKLIRALVSRGLVPREEAEQMVQESERGAIAPGGPVAAAAPPIPAAAATAPVAAGATAARVAPTVPAAPATAESLAGEASTPARIAKESEELAEEAPSDESVVRVPYVPELVKNQIRDQVREEVIAQAKAERWAEPNSLPEWLDRISWSGDLMLRYEADRFGRENTPVLTYNAITGANLTNTTQSDDRFRYRARIGLSAKITQTWSAGFGIASGDINSPVATLQTLGNYAERGALTIDRAYLRWDPDERFTLSGGRMANPYFNTDLVWDIDLAFEGAYASYRPRLSDQLSGFATAGAYILQYQSSTPTTPEPKNKYLVGLQAGADWAASTETRLRAAVSYYDYKNVSGIPNPTLNSQIYDWTAPLFRQKGNTVFNIDNDANPTTNLFALASKFQILNFTAKLDLLHFDPLNVRLIGDYAKNIGFDQAEIQRRTGLVVEPHTTAWRGGFMFGKLEVNDWRDWQFFADYRYIGADSVLDAFVDSEFYLGGTNAKGYTVGGLFGLDRNVWIRLRWMSADEIIGPPLAIDILQLDLNARF